MKKALIVGLSSLFVLPAALASESEVPRYTFTHSETRTINEVRLNARHVGQEIQYGVALDILYNAQQALAGIPKDPAMQLAAEEKQEAATELTMK